MRVPNATTFLVVAWLAIPATGIAQIVIPAPPPDTPPPLRLFEDATPEPNRGRIGSIKSPNWWEPPVSGSEIPRWAIGHNITFNTAGGLALSAGIFGRRGDPLPLYISEGSTQRARPAVTGPGSYRLQWDVKLGVSVPVWNGPRLKLNAIGELFVPVAGSNDRADPSATFLKSLTPRFGVVTRF
jgi:hypothetical protein